MNGTVTMNTMVDAFVTRELAEESLTAVKEANKDSMVSVEYDDIEEIDLFETRDDVPILNQEGSV